MKFVPVKGERNEEINKKKMSESVNGSSITTNGSLEEENSNGMQKKHSDDDETKYVTYVSQHRKINKRGGDVICDLHYLGNLLYLLFAQRLIISCN